MHNAMNLQPPRSPISPSPPEVEIPSVEERVRYGKIFYPDVGGSSHPPHPSPPGEGVFGAYAGYSYGAVGSSQQPPRTSEAEQIAARVSNSIFGDPFGMSSFATTSLNPSLGTVDTSFEATILPENAYLTSNLWIGLHDWGDRTPSDGNGNGGNGQ